MAASAPGPAKKCATCSSVMAESGRSRFSRATNASVPPPEAGWAPWAVPGKSPDPVDPATYTSSPEGEKADVPAMHGWRRDLFGSVALDLIGGKVALRFVNKKIEAVEL